MNIVTSRGKLDVFLKDPTLTLLLLFGDTPGQRALATAADTVSDNQPWRQAVIVSDVNMLSNADIESMEALAGSYAVLGVSNDQKRVLVVAGQSKDLLLQSGGPSILRLRQAFAKGDQA